MYLRDSMSGPARALRRSSPGDGRTETIILKTMRMYRFWFYQFYRWSLRTWGSNDLPALNAALFLSGLPFLNVYSVLLFAELALGNSPVFDILLDRYSSLGIWIIIFTFNLVYLTRGGRLERICEEFKDQPSTPKTILFFWAYPAVTFALYLCLVEIRLS